MVVDRKEQGATRQIILQLLRHRGQMTAIELSKALDIGAVGVRQHLTLLERDGLVCIKGLRRSVGRPSHLYVLTSEAEHYFPKNYDRLATDLLTYITEEWGEEGVTKVLNLRRKALLQKYEPQLKGRKRSEQIAELAKLLIEQGYMCEYEQLADGSFFLIEHNCPIGSVAHGHPQLCGQEILLYEHLLNVPIERDATIVDGSLFCRYHIPAENV